MSLVFPSDEYLQPVLPLPRDAPCSVAVAALPSACFSALRCEDVHKAADICAVDVCAFFVLLNIVCL